MIIKGILFIIIFPLILVLLGDKFLRYVGWNRSLPASFIWGYVLILALFQFIAFPLFRLNSSFSLLFWIITLLIGSSIIWIIIEIVYKQKKSKEFVFKTYKQGIIVFFRNCRLYPFLAVLLLLCILFCIFMSEGFYYSSSDEGYNIPRALETIAQNSLGINDVLSWRGIYTNDAAPYSNASTYYFFIAWLSCIFGIHTTVLYKTFLLFILIFLHLSAVCTMYNSVKPNHSFPEKTVFIIFYILFQMLCVKPSSAGTWMTGYLYEGKATMIAIVFPLLLSTCTNIMRTIRNSGINSKREWLAVTIVLTAGIELSIVGIFLPVILYFCFGAAFLIGTKFQYFSKIILPAILSTVPVIICGIFVISPALTLFSDSEEIIVNSTTQIITHHNSILLLFSSWKSHFLEAIDFWQLILFLGGAVYYSFHGSQIEKILFVLSPLVLLLTFLNPFLCGIVSKYITTPIVYWRLWWLLPIYFVPSSAITDIFNRLSEGKIQKTLLICLIPLFTVSGFEIFRYSITDVNYTIIPFVTSVGKLFNVRPELRNNIYNLNPGPLGIAEAIVSDWDGTERPLVLMTFNRPFELRQYSQEIALVTEIRNYHNVTGVIPGTEVDFGEFITSYNSIVDGTYLRNMLLLLHVDYVCFDENPSVDHLEEFGFKHICYSGGIDLWRVLT